MEDYVKLLMGLPIAGFSGYLIYDALTAFNIRQINDDFRLKWQASVLPQCSMDDNLKSRDRKALNALEEVLLDWEIQGNVDKLNSPNYCQGILYEAALREIQRTNSVGIISWITKHVNIKSLRRKQKNLEERAV